MLWIVFVSTFGFVFSNRLLRYFLLKYSLPRQIAWMSQNALLALVLGNVFLFFDDLLLLWVGQFLVILLSLVLPLGALWYTGRGFQQIETQFLDALILNLQSGMSFRIAYQEAMAFHKGWVLQILQKIFDSIVNHTAVTDVPVPEICSFDIRMRVLDEKKSRVIEQAKTYRTMIRLRDQFRHRSGQIQKQIYFQIGILIMLYMGLLGFVVHSYGFKKNAKVIFLSACLLLLGSASVYFLGGKRKWKT